MGLAGRPVAFLTMRIFKILLLTIFCLAPAYSVCAKPIIWKSSHWVKEKPYMEKIGHKLGFGVLNAATGWTAFFFEPPREKNPLAGLVRGIFLTFSHTAGGVLHAATFPLPFDIPLPEGGVSFEDESNTRVFHEEAAAI